jgi:hypothetical protein
MYIRTLLDTTCFKTVMAMDLSNSAVNRASSRVIPEWVTSWKVWFGGAKSEQYCVGGGGSLQMASEPLLSLRWRERTQAHEGPQRALVGTPRMGRSHEGR